MQKVIGNLWHTPADWLCITTNGLIRSDGKAVMGKGCAEQAISRVPEVQRTLGSLLLKHGNHVYFLGHYGTKRVYSFPTKHDWHLPSPPELIEQSARELKTLWTAWKDVTGTAPKVLIPRPGCGAGALQWGTVEPLLAPLLPEPEFAIIAFNAREFS